MKIICEYIILIVRDSHGNVWKEAVSETGNNVLIYNIKDAAGEALYFEAEAYHLEGFCKEFGLEFFEFKREAEIELPTQGQGGNR